MVSLDVSSNIFLQKRNFDHLDLILFKCLSCEILFSDFVYLLLEHITFSLQFPTFLKQLTADVTEKLLAYTLAGLPPFIEKLKIFPKIVTKKRKENFLLKKCPGQPGLLPDCPGGNHGSVCTQSIPTGCGALFSPNSKTKSTNFSQ